MRVLLLQLDGKLPNIALMRLAAHHRDLWLRLERCIEIAGRAFASPEPPRGGSDKTAICQLPRIEDSSTFEGRKAELERRICQLPPEGAAK